MLDKDGEIASMLKRHGEYEAELQDGRLVAEQQAAQISRQNEEHAVLSLTVRNAEFEAASVRSRCSMLEDTLMRYEEECKASQARLQAVEQERAAANARIAQCKTELEDLQARERAAEEHLDENVQRADHFRALLQRSENANTELKGCVNTLQGERDHLKENLDAALCEHAKIQEIIDQLVSVEGKSIEESAALKGKVEMWKLRADNAEREYAQATELNQDMTNVMSQMTLAVSEQSEITGDHAKQNKALAKQLADNLQELRATRQQKDQLQRQFDSMQSLNAFHAEKWKKAREELAAVQEEGDPATVNSKKMNARMKKLMCAEKQAENSRDSLDSACMKELQCMVAKKHDAIEVAQADYAKAQKVNEFLVKLLTLQVEQTAYFETECTLKSSHAQGRLAACKEKAQSLISKLNAFLSQEDALQHRRSSGDGLEGSDYQ
eukprot:NODE_4162_length_1928_cov_6.169906.p1 GENE.NODE_4162_length_1928_cov_6.169906~~NODE_4162_length_1928_cov_6.169906.p1  ORF type:complete len:439 (-),score=136.31 NODE_4162_length_1928_cov_6.169906:228-1544(-)